MMAGSLPSVKEARIAGEERGGDLPRGWKLISFFDAVHLNPKVNMIVGKEYSFIDMKLIEPERCQVSQGEARPFNSSGSKFLPGDTLMARITPCLENGKIARYMPNEKQAAFGSTEFIVIRGKYGVTDNDFVYYLAMWPKFRSFAVSQMTGTSGRQRVPAKSLAGFKFRLPPLSEQRRIAEILGSLDDKIELNRRMSETLEAISQAIFKSWFIDFDPVIDNALAAGNEIPEALQARAKARQAMGDKRQPLPPSIQSLFPAEFELTSQGPIPKGWNIGTVGNIATQTLGGQWGEESPKEGTVPAICLRGCDMEDIRLYGYAPNAPVRHIKKNAIDKRIPSETDILIAGSGAGPCGRPLWFASSIAALYDEPVIYSNFVKRLTTPTAAHAIYLDRLLFGKFNDKSIHDFIGGTSVPNLDAEGLLKTCGIIIPTTNVLEKFEWFCRPYYNLHYIQQSNTLSNLRDTLLPKFLAGRMSLHEYD